MINTKELRQGNKVMVTFTEDQAGFGKDYIGEIVAVIERKVRVKEDWHWIELDGISPIPLTPEILEKAGFRQMLTDGWYVLRPDLCFNGWANGFKYYFPYNYLNMMGADIRVYYLHQLQNLYFALTGQELTINL